ncbi:Isoleucine-tRNA ligase, cytoplasmic [Purpureocillium lavendulum]|uniref:Isoleucine-tRNA ligase, cytoplasmic n=1 Tax=Purpureocillium lavendulum TaxID=1247861 RepID=A0AB34FRV3_9HYPO|nr:Isoleucine-tRNA ligase, cytoplasmic [Purpureocillium lavendulum]
MSRSWLPAAKATFFGIEVILATTLLVLFSVSYPTRVRSRLWEEGGSHKWNSDPRLRIYFYANHREPPEIPLIWSHRLAASNLSIAILTVFVLFTRIIVSHLGYFPKYTNALYDLLLLSLWSVSIIGQSSADHSDPRHPCEHPWYLMHSCTGIAERNRGYCRVAQASFLLSILALLVYGSRLLHCAYQALFSSDNDGEQEFAWERAPNTKAMPAGDLEWTTERETEKHGWLDQPLSPVLAFFTETSE